VLPRLEGGARKGEVGVGWSAEDDDVYFRVGEEGVEGGAVLDGWVVLGGGVSGGGAALEDGVQFEGRGEGDEGDVEDFGREAGSWSVQNEKGWWGGEMAYP
jgi:hypothetical protein